MQGYLINSLTASVTATVIAVLLAIPAAYALSIRRVKNVEGSLTFFISTRFMPLAAVVLPLFMIFKELGLLDNIYALAIVYAAVNLPVTVWMMRSFFLEVPFEIIEAARVDGAGLYREIVRIVLPLVLPGVAAAALFCFIFSWNEYFLSTLPTSSSARTTPPFLGSFVDGRGQFLAVLSAGQRRSLPCRSSSPAGSRTISSSVVCRWEPSSDRRRYRRLIRPTSPRST